MDARSIRGVVEAAHARRESAHHRSQHEHEDGGDRKPPNHGGIAEERPNGVRERHRPGYSGRFPGAADLLASIARLSEVRLAPRFDDRITERQARVGVIGLGYAGLPLAIAFAEAGFDVTGIDLDADRVRAIGERRSYLVDVPAERYEGLAGTL